MYSSTFTEKNKSAHTVEVKSSSHIAQASSDIKKFHTNPVIDVSISKGEVKLARNIFETLSTHKKPTPPPKPVSSTIPRISPESKRITSDPASSHPWSTIEDVRSRLHHVNTSNRVYNHPGSETSFSEQENLKRSEELKLEDARINLKPVSILKEDNKENNEATQGKEEETSEISSDKINDTIGISGDFNIVEHSTQSENDLKEIEEIGVLEMDNSKKVKMSERENNGDRVCNTRPDSGYCTTVGERGRNSKENESDETNRSSSVNVSEIINQKTNTADIISRIPDPDEQSGGKMELDQEPKEAALLVHKSNGSVNVSCSNVVTLNKQSDETNRSSSENVLENVNQRTNTAEITSQTTESDEQNGDTVEQEEEQRVSIVQLRKSKRNVSVTHNDAITVLAAGNQADTQENYPPLAFPNTRGSQTSSSSSESENKDRTTISSQNIIDKSKLEENENKAASTELDQKEARNLSTSHHDNVDGVVESVSPMHKSNGSVNVSCSDLVTLNKQSDKTNRSSSENVLENVNQRTNTAEITSQTTESDEQNGDTVEQEEEQRVSIVQLRKSKRSVSVTHNDVISVLAAGNQADTQENYPPLAFPNTRRSQTSSSSSESENKDRTTISSQNIIDKSKLEENEIKAASTELDQKEERKLSTSHHELVENYLDIDFLISKANFPNIPALPNTTPSRADLISFHELKDTLDTLGSEDECSEVPSEDDERSEVNSTSSDQIIQRLSRLVES